MRPFLRTLAAGAILAIAGRADVSLPAILGSHMVLQRAPKVPVWGWAAPGEDVAVEFSGRSVRAVADRDGRWRVVLDLMNAPAGPGALTITGGNRVVLDDVLVGEVWLASGQSNMEFPLRQSIGGAEEIASAANSRLRLFKVARAPSLDPQEDTKGRWLVASPESVASFSAVASRFARILQQTLDVPVGIVDTAIGGSPAEAWMSPEGLARVPGVAEGGRRILDEVVAGPQRLADYRRLYPQWLRVNQREDRPARPPAEFAAPVVSPSGWQTVRLPATFSSIGLPDSGVVWLRKTIAVAPSMATGPLRVDLGGITDFATVYWNGEKIGETTHAADPGLETRFTFEVPASAVRPGDAVLAVRVFSPAGGAGLKAAGAGSDFRVIRDGLNRVFLAGDWQAKVEYVLPPLVDGAARDRPLEPAPSMPPKGLPSALFNGLINPIRRMAVRGIIWYQGEANTARAWQYRATFPALIDDWRKQWDRPDLPFYFCQLANFGPHQPEPGESSWAELREAQATTRARSNTGMAVLIDVGEEADIHPRDKAATAKRLALLALSRQYGRTENDAGPVLVSMQFEGPAIRLKFASTGGELVARALPESYQPRSTEPVTRPTPRHRVKGDLEGFAICGEDRRWVWADEARIEGDCILVRSALVPRPVAVRYAWADNPVCNLVGGTGLPAEPFRTDDFPATTGDAHY